MCPILAASFAIMRSWVFLTLLLAGTLVSGRRQSRSIPDFYNVIKCVKPDSRPLLDYNDYGCYCGLGGSGQPKDELDNCCQTHDNCYSKYNTEDCKTKKLLDQVINVGRFSYSDSYKFTCEDNTVICSSENDPCEAHLCECDKEAANCFSKAPYNEEYRFYINSGRCK